MSVQSQIDRITGAKTTLGNYLQQNGVAVPTGATLDEMALLLADVIEKQAKITARGILKGDGQGGVTAAVAGTDYLKTAPVTSVNGKTGAVTVRELPAVSASDNGKSAAVVNGAWAAVDKTPFYVNCTISGYNVYDEEVTHDKTYAEILAAYQAGRPCYAILSNSAGAKIITLPLTNTDEDNQEAIFSLVQMIQGDEPNAISAYYVDISTDYAEGRCWSYYGVPYVAESDEGKFLRVVNGAWQAATVPDANGGSF